ncbi:MAG: twitching motility protein PilT [Lachnospiraceae bacterium]|nr:twitching motility protein PilT [Lachnospiraceae bacterium]
MVEIIAGDRGKGKTRYLINRIHEDIKAAAGDIVYIDKSQKHMYELTSKVRLINMADYAIGSTDEFLGFLSGAISQNSDIEEIALDSFLTIANIKTTEELSRAIEKLDIISEKFNVRFVLCVSKDEVEMSESVKAKVIETL